MKTKLSDFLKENNAYKKFKKNLIDDYNKGNSLEEIGLDKNWISDTGKALISGAFVWKCTSELEDYWHNLFIKIPDDTVNDLGYLIQGTNSEELFKNIKISDKVKLKKKLKKILGINDKKVIVVREYYDGKVIVLDSKDQTWHIKFTDIKSIIKMN